MVKCKETNEQRRISVKDLLQNLEFGDYIELIWIDASRCENVLPQQMEINRMFATYKKTVGKFFSIRKDQTYEEPYVIVIIDDSNPKRSIVESVPLVCVMKITWLKPAGIFKRTTEQGRLILGGGTLKVVSGMVGEIIEQMETEQEGNE